MLLDILVNISKLIDFYYVKINLKNLFTVKWCEFRIYSNSVVIFLIRHSAKVNFKKSKSVLICFGHDFLNFGYIALVWKIYFIFKGIRFQIRNHPFWNEISSWKWSIQRVYNNKFKTKILYVGSRPENTEDPFGSHNTIHQIFLDTILKEWNWTKLPKGWLWHLRHRNLYVQVIPCDIFV